jgi:hypothetical protein
VPAKHTHARRGSSGIRGRHNRKRVRHRPREEGQARTNPLSPVHTRSHTREQLAP